ncbi:MAG: fluoride efflux transporter CrcB [Dehalococcoidia bacterium]
MVRVGLVAAGGAFGSISRYLVALYTAQYFGGTFPWGTLVVNVVGSFLIGVLATLADEVGVIGPETRVLLVVGVLGGFTTFSSFSLDTLRLLEANELLRGGLYVCASLAVSFLAATAGIALARALNR